MEPGAGAWAGAGPSPRPWTAMGSGTLKYPAFALAPSVTAATNSQQSSPLLAGAPRNPTSRHRAAAPTASALQRRRPMDHFYDGQYVWLRNNVHGTYLHADSDGRSISLHRRRASLKAAWGVHIYQGNNATYLLLYSAAYGRYLAATDTRAPVIHRGYRTEQRDYDQPEMPAIMWQAADNGLGNTSVLLRDTRGRHLRGNGKHTGKFLGWYTGVTVDDIDYVSSMMHWTVQTIPLRGVDMPQPGFAAPIPTLLQELSVKLGRERGVWRLIRFVRASAEGGYAEDGNGWVEFHFEGRLVYSLRNRVHNRLDRPVNLFGFAMCVRAGRYGHLTPLVKNLPHGGNGETLQIVVYLPGTPAYDELRHPDVYSQ